jgi:hypothetical protein
MKLIAKLARVGGRAAASGFGLLLISLLILGALISIAALDFGAAVILSAAAALAIIGRRRGRRDAAQKRKHILSAQIDGLTEAGWATRDTIDTPFGPIDHLAVAPGDRCAFAILVAEKEVSPESLYAVADAADWLAQGGRYAAVVAVLVAGALRDVEQLDGPVLVVSTDRLVEALYSANQETARLVDQPAERAPAEVA